MAEMLVIAGSEDKFPPAAIWIKKCSQILACCTKK